MDIEKILWLILAAIMLPAFGVGVSAMASGQHRVSRRPPAHPPGWKNRQRERRANTASTRRGGTVAKKGKVAKPPRG